VVQEIQSKHSQIQTCLPFRTDVKGEIRTLDDNAIYSKQYPYPHSVNNFVNQEIKRLLNENIIKPSRSPFNSPVWVVGKKGFNEDGTQKHRLVIDFKKLNDNTIPDRYPMPDPTVILSNLGKARFFSTIDLESGGRPITMAFTIETTDKPLNCFRNQVILEETRYSLHRRLIMFGNKTRHMILFTDRNNLIETLKLVVNHDVVNAFHCDFPILVVFRHELVSLFPPNKFWHC
ncbi:hypothetical protein KR044_001665, partial [Drosophila immigrans]